MNNDQATSDSTGKDWIINVTLNKLRKRQYKLKFRREATCLYCIQLREWIMPEEFSVDTYYYFEDLSNPDAERILYAISITNGRKGFLLDSCNVYTDNISSEMMEKLKLNKLINRRNELVNAVKRNKRDRLINEALAF